MVWNKRFITGVKSQANMGGGTALASVPIIKLKLAVPTVGKKS